MADDRQNDGALTGSSLRGDPASALSSVADPGQRLERQQRVRQALLLLSPECRTLLTAMCYDRTDAAREEAARKLGLSEEQMATQRAICLRRLVEVLSEGGAFWELADPGAATSTGAPCSEPFADLVAYASGELRGEALERLTMHLRTGCPRCRQDLQKLEQLLGLMHTDPSAPAPQKVGAEARALSREAPGAQSGPWTQLPQRGRRMRGMARGLGVVAAIAALALGLALASAYWPAPRTGTIADIIQGGLRLKLGQGAPWATARAGQLIGQGARLESAADTVALVRFWDDSLLRIESEGEWAIVRLAGSRNQRNTRVTVQQTGGKASYASRALAPGVDAPLRIELPGAIANLVGTATFTVLDDGALLGQVHQGSAHLDFFGSAVDLLAGQQLTVQADGQYQIR